MSGIWKSTANTRMISMRNMNNNGFDSIKFQVRGQSKHGAWYVVNTHTGEIISAWRDMMVARKLAVDLNRGFR